MSDEEATSGKLVSKMKENPTVPLGLMGLLGVVGYSAYHIKNRTGALSVYLINTRVAAQTTLMVSISLGLLYSMVNKNWNKLFPEKKN